MGSMTLADILSVPMFQSILTTFDFNIDLPWTCIWVYQFTHKSTFLDGFDISIFQNVISNRKQSWVRSTLVNVLMMIGLVVMSHIARNCAPTLKELGLFNWKCWYFQRFGVHYLMLLCREVNRKVKLPSSNQQATGHVSAKNWRRIPCIQRHHNTFQSNTIVAAIISKNSETRVDKSADALNNHWIMIFTG